MQGFDPSNPPFDRLTQQEVDAVTAALDIGYFRPGEAIVKVRWTPYWFAQNACVEPHGDWTRLIAEEEGFVRLSTRFAPERLFQRGRRCDD